MFASTSPDSRPSGDFELGRLLKLAGDDRELLGELIALFERDSTRLVAEIREAAVRLDGKALERAAHTLRGLLLYVGESTAHDRCRRLESLGSCPELAGAEIDALDIEVAMIRQGLARVGRSANSLDDREDPPGEMRSSRHEA
jgi:HPt (histidine-containing phosphotransfer) domain-containing protein